MVFLEKKNVASLQSTREGLIIVLSSCKGSRKYCQVEQLWTIFQDFPVYHGCSNESNLEMAAEFLTKNVSNLNLNISRTKNGRNKL